MQVFLSKVGLAAVAALVMLVILAVSTVVFTDTPSSEYLNEMFRMWLVAILEALAWGTLFSLLSARPLVAVVLAVAAASTVAHLLAWTITRGPIHAFEFGPYLKAVPLRLLSALVVLGVNTYLGLRWLGDGTAVLRLPRSIAALRQVTRGPQARGERIGCRRAVVAARSGRNAGAIVVAATTPGGMVDVPVGEPVRRADGSIDGQRLARRRRFSRF